MDDKPLESKRMRLGWRKEVATGMRPGDYPLGSLESRAAVRAILKDSEPSQYDKDARTLHGTAHLTADMAPSYQDLEETAVYLRGRELRDMDKARGKRSTLDEYLAGGHATSAGTDFCLAFGRVPNKGDILRFDDVRYMYGPELHLLCLENFIDAWERQLTMPCPLKIDNGRVFRRISGALLVETPRWELEESRKDYELRWDSTEREAGRKGIRGVTFEEEGRCRPATEEELNGPPVESERGLVGVLMKVARGNA